MQLQLYAAKSKAGIIMFIQDLIQEVLLLEPSSGVGSAATCTFDLSPYGYFYFRVFAIPIYQYLLVLAVGKTVDRWVDPEDLGQAERAGGDGTRRTLANGHDDDAEKTLPEKVKDYMFKHYDSSELRYLRILPDEPMSSEVSRVDAMRMWWQASTKSLKRKQARKQLWRGQLQVLVAVYIPITKLCIMMLFCQAMPTPDGEHVWISSFDESLGCFSSSHLIATIAAFMVLGMFTVGFPLFIYLKMEGLRDHNGSWKPGRFTSLVRLSYVFEEDRRSWQAVVMLRQVWLVGAKVTADIYASPENNKLPWGNGELDWRWGPFCVILISVHLQAAYRPYTLWHDNILEQSCLLALLLVIWGDVTLATSEAMNMMVLALVLMFIAGLYVSQVRGR